jgi:Flp pilus assembly protein TadG
MLKVPTRQRRRGVALVEFAFVALLFMMLLFGIIEYCRLIFTQQVMFNAVREGARFAVVNSGGDPNLVTDTQAVVLQKMAGVNNSVTGYACTVFLADSNGNNIGAATTALFGQLIGVQITCTYSPIVPSLLFMNKSITLTTKSYMYSESN